MKQLLTALFLLVSIFSTAQVQPLGTVIGRQTVISVSRSAGGTQAQALLWLPDDYAANPTKQYPIIFFFHGAGEGNSNNITQVTNTSLPQAIKNGFNAYGIDSLTGDTTKFIVVSPHAASSFWSFNMFDHGRYIVDDILSRYRVKTDQVFLTGLSAGGDGINKAAKLDTTWLKKICGIFPMAAADAGSDVSVLMPRFAQAKVAWVSIMGADDGHVTSAIRDYNNIMAANPIAPVSLLQLAGVGHTSAAWNPPFTTSNTWYGGVNMLTRMARMNRSTTAIASPTANAGSDKSITLPTSSTSLTGSGTPQTGGSITSYAWTKISGPGTYSITSASSATTAITGLTTAGTYVFRLTVTTNTSLTATDDVTVVVNPAIPNAPPTVSAGSDQTITLPVNSVNVTSTSADPEGLTTSGVWSKVKAPGSPATPWRIGIIGSSTGEGAGPANIDSSFARRLKAYYKGLGIIDTIYNLSLGGTNPFGAVGTGFTGPGPHSPSIDATRNIDAILAKGINVLIVTFPTNAFEDPTGLTVAEIMAAFRHFRDKAALAGIKCYISTTQPRTSDEFNNPASQTKLQVIRDSVVAAFGAYAIDVWNMVTYPGTSTIIPQYAAGDEVHLNARGHREIFNNIVAMNIFKDLVSSGSVISTPTTANTNITGLTQGVHLFQRSVFDSDSLAQFDVMQVTVNGSSANVPPTVNAGENQTILGTTANLLATPTDGDGTIASVMWTQTGGPAATITSPTSASTTITGMNTGGVYTFRLTATDDDGDNGFDEVQITKLPLVEGCGGVRIQLAPNNITSISGGQFITSLYLDGNTFSYNPGDTLVLKKETNKKWGYFSFTGIHGTSECPVVIINDGAVEMINGFGVYSSTHLKIVGTGEIGTQYGFTIKDTLLIPGDGVAVSIGGKSKNIEVSNLFINRKQYGFWIKNEAECDTTINYPYHWLDSIKVHDCFIRNMGSQGFYMGSTDPNNLDRPIDCGGVTKYYTPTRLSNIEIYNNIVDSTGRPGIQLSGAMAGVNRIHHNTVTRTGYQFDAAQGTGISLGTYTRCLVDSNTVRNTYTWNIASLGGSGLVEIRNNNLDSASHLGDVTWASNILIDTRITEPADSTRFKIRGNILGRKGSTQIYNIEVGNQVPTYRSTGNEICGNTSTATGYAVYNVASGITYTTCEPPANKRIPRKVFNSTIFINR
ncbi:PKD domain-containing protein [Flavitalea antarctica]